jgi:plasmid stabilization system protein ParE
VADFLFHPEAQDDYITALAWYQTRSARTATRFEAEVQRVLDLIDDNPSSFPHYDDEHRFALLRRFPYCIVYQEQPARVYVIAVAHGSRSPGYWKGRK